MKCQTPRYSWCSRAKAVKISLKATDSKDVHRRCHIRCHLHKENTIHQWHAPDSRRTEDQSSVVLAIQALQAAVYMHCMVKSLKPTDQSIKTLEVHTYCR